MIYNTLEHDILSIDLFLREKTDVGMFILRPTNRAYRSSDDRIPL